MAYDSIAWTTYRYLSEKLDKRIAQVSDTVARLDRLIVSLSAGAIVFSATLVSNFAPLRLWLIGLLISWASFLGAIICVVFATRAEQQVANTEIINTGNTLSVIANNPDIRAKMDREQFPPVQDHPNPSQTIGWLNIAALIFLLVGLMSLATFAAYNVWKTPIVPEQKRKPFTASSVVELIVSAGVVSRNTLDAGAT